MTSPGGRSEVGSAYVVMRAITAKLKKDILKGVQEGWSEASVVALSDGRTAGKRWARGFKAGVSSERIGAHLSKQWRDMERDAGLSGARAGERYATAYNNAIRRQTRTTPPTTGGPGGQGTPDESTSRTRRAPRRVDPADREPAGGGGNAANSSEARRERDINDEIERAYRRRERQRRRAERDTGGGDNDRNRRPIIQRITTVLNDNATRILRIALLGIMTLLKGIAVLSAAAMAALAGQAALGALLSITAALAQMVGLLNLIPAGILAAAVPMAVLKMATTGVMDAFKATKASAEEMAAAQASKAKEVANAQKGVESAERGIVSAQDAVARSAKGVESAQRGRTAAQETLNRALKEAKERLEDLALAEKGALLDERSAILGVERAQERLANMPKGSTALDYKEAVLGLDEAKQRLEEVKERNGDLKEEIADANTKGVEGADAVVNAKQGIVEADEQIAEANKGLADSQQELTDAQLRLTEAQEALTEAQNKAISVNDNYEKAMSKLSTNARGFVEQVRGLSGEFTELRKSVQDKFFAGLGNDIVNLWKVQLPGLTAGLGGVATGLNGMAKDVIKAFAAPDAVDKFALVLGRISDFVERMRPGVFALVGVWKNLATVGSEFLGGFADGFTNSAQKFEKWSMNWDNVRNVIQKAIDVTKSFWNILKNLGSGINAIFQAAEGPGTSMLSTLEGITLGFKLLMQSTEGQSALTTFFINADAAMKAIAPILKEVFFIITEVASQLAGLGTAIAPGVLVFVTGLREGFQKLQPAFDTIGPKISDLFAALGDNMPRLGEVVSRLVIAFSPWIDVMTILTQTLMPVALTILEKLAPVLSALAPLIVGIALGWKMYMIYTRLAPVLTAAWTAAQWLLNTALNANPIGLIVLAIAALVGGIILAYNKSDKFREIVQKLWEAIKTGAAAAWEKIYPVFQWIGKFIKETLIPAFMNLWQGVILPAFKAIGEVISWVWNNIIVNIFKAYRFYIMEIIVPAVMWLWQNVIVPAFNAIGAVISWVWENIIKPAWEGMKIALQILGDFFGWVWNSVIKPAWDALGTGISWVWENIIKPNWEALKLALQLLGDFFGWIWNSIIKPAWDALGAGIAWVWENVIKPNWEALKLALQVLGDFFSWVWNSVIKPAWNALGDGIKWVWENVIQKAFEALKSGLTGVKDWFGSMVTTIGELWGKIQDIVKVPIRFVIDKIYNNGIVKAWNGIAGLIGMDNSKLEPMSLEGFATGGVPDRRKGGVESGYSPGKDDRIIAVGGGEAIMRPEFTRAVGTGYVNKVNAAARSGGVGGVQKLLNDNPNIPRFNKGGPVDLGAAPWTGGGGESNLKPAAILARRNIHKYWPEIDTIGGYRAQDAYPDHPSGLALDTMTFDPAGTQVNDWLHQQKDALALNYTIWKQFYKPAGGGGNMMEDRGSPTQNHMDHIHSLFNANGVAGIQDGGAGSDNGGGFWDSLVGAVRGSATWGYKQIMKPLREVVEKTTNLGGGLFGEIPLKFFDKLNGAAESFISGKDPGGSSQGGSANWLPSAGAEQWRQMVIDAYKNQGYESNPAKIDAWVRQIDTESGGDPNIAQQIVDVNGTGEAAGVGLGQMIPGTWDAYRDPALPNNRRDPWAMINAMVRYGERKYGGNLLGTIGQGHGYDKGGWLQPGLTLANNKTGVPEAILNPFQWDNAAKAISVADMIAQNMGTSETTFSKDNQDAWARNQQSEWTDWSKNALKEISGQFTEPLGLNSYSDREIDRLYQVAADAAAQAAANVAAQQAAGNDGKIADTVNFVGMDPQKVTDEINRDLQARGAYTSRYPQG